MREACFPLPWGEGQGEEEQSVRTMARTTHSRECGHSRYFFLLLSRPLKVSSAMPDLSSSPRPSLTMRSYCFLVEAASGRFKPFSLARFKAMPESFAACALEKKQECSRFCMSSPSVWSTRELAPVC